MPELGPRPWQPRWDVAYNHRYQGCRVASFPNLGKTRDQIDLSHRGPRAVVAKTKEPGKALAVDRLKSTWLIAVAIVVAAASLLAWCMHRVVAAETSFGYLLAGGLAIVVYRRRTVAMSQRGLEAESRRPDTRPVVDGTAPFRALVRNACDVIGTIDRQGTITFVSPSVKRLTGFEPEEVLGPIAEIIHPEEVAVSLIAFGELLKSPGGIDSLVFRMKCKDGSYKHVETLAQNCLHEPSVNAIVYSTRDLSESRHSRHALIRSEQLYRSLFDNMLNGFAHCKMVYEDEKPVDFVYLDVNDSFENLTGLRNVVGRNVSDVIPNIRELDPELFEIYDRVARTGQSERFERFIEAMKMWFAISVYSPATGHFVAVFDVITERKRTESKLQASEARFRSIFDQVTDGIMLVDSDNETFVMANRAMCQLLDHADQELLYHKLGDFFPEAQRRRLTATFAELVNGERQVVHDIPLVHKDGAILYADVNFATIVIDERKLVMGSVRDVTEKRALQARVAQADRLATMGMLAAGVAHEINNPLSYVLYNIEDLIADLPRLVDAVRLCSSALQAQVGDAAFAEVVGDAAQLLQPALLDDIVERAREALSGGQRIKAITRGLGTFSRVEQAERTKVDLKFPIECAINMAYNEIKFKAHLVKDLAKISCVFASDGKLSQVFLNLLINAAHSIDEGHPDDNRIGIRTWEDGGDVFVEVTDTGKGISKHDLDRIFEPFFTTKPVGVGSGLGLAICRSIVTEFGGDIRAESEVGHGSRFVVRLAAYQQPELPSRDSIGPRRETSPNQGGRVLIVDDEPLIRASLRRMLESDHRVEMAASGTAGRDLLERDRNFDVILCDLMMPNMSGMELHEWLTKRDPALAARIVFLTGGAYTPWASQYMATVGNLRIEKPVEAADLRRIVVQRVIERRRAPIND